MADNSNDRDRVNENIGDEMDDEKGTKRQQGASRSDAQNEPTDTLEDRNLSGSSTWATLPEQNESDESEDSDTDSTKR